MEPAIFGVIDAVLAPVAEYVILALVIANMATRLVAHRRQVEQVGEGAEDVDRYPVHEVTNVLLLLAVLYFVTVHYHAGFVLATLAIAMVVTDVFEFESRRVEARQGWDLDAPKASVMVSLLALVYAAYVTFLPPGPIGQFF